MKDTTKQEAMDKIKHMFDKFDIDNDDHLAIVIMYDKKKLNDECSKNLFWFNNHLNKLIILK